MKKQPLLTILALLSVYFIWGSTYLAMRFAVQAIPPLLMAGSRYLIAGSTILLALWLLKKPMPTRRQWLHTGWVGVLLLLGGNGAVCLALEQGVSSGLSALVLAVTPLFVLVISYIWGLRANGREWLGIVLGFVGIVILNFGHELRASPLAGALLIFAATSWSLGSIWGKHLDQASGFMASAIQMIVGGLALLIVGGLRGERVHALPAVSALWAMAYLIFIGAILGFSSYVYLIATVRPALAISYAYVNPLVAVVLGVLLGGEQVDVQEQWAMGVIILGVVLVCLPQRSAAPVELAAAPAEAD